MTGVQVDEADGGGALSQVVAGARAGTDAGLAPAERTEAGLNLATGRPPEAENDLFHASRAVIRAILRPRVADHARCRCGQLA
jgi:hypothetical protein